MTRTGPPQSHRLIPEDRLNWLTRELEVWQSDGLISSEAASQLRQQYGAESRRFTLVRLTVALGSVFVGAGLIWLVATNIEHLSPMVRFLAVTFLWLALTALAEILAGRLASSEVRSPLVTTTQVLAVAAYGAVIFQAAQSLQVPSDSPRLIGLWGLGALLYAYAVRGRSALIIAVTLVVGWLMVVGTDTGSLARSFTFGTLWGGLAATAIAVGHRRRWRADFSPPWQVAGVVLTLSGLFIASIPADGWADEGHRWAPILLIGAALTPILAIVALVLGDVSDRHYVLAAAAALGIGTVLFRWQPGDDPQAPQVWARAALAVVGGLGVAAWIALIGAWRREPRITALATVFVILFTTVQSFAVFASIMSGAVLFLLVGVTLLATGYLAMRGRSHLVNTVGSATP